MGRPSDKRQGTFTVGDPKSVAAGQGIDNHRAYCQVMVTAALKFGELV